MLLCFHRAVPDPSSLVVTIPVSKLRKVLRLPPHKSSRQRIPKTKPALVTESGKTFTSQGVQADSGLVIDRNVSHCDELFRSLSMSTHNVDQCTVFPPPPYFRPWVLAWNDLTLALDPCFSAIDDVGLT